jgi:hypothetical protein
MVVLAEHNIERLFVRGKLLNLGSKEIVAYRIGWAFQGPGHDAETHLGQWVNTPKPLMSANFVEVPAQHVSAAPFATARARFSSWRPFATETVTLGRLI